LNWCVNMKTIKIFTILLMVYLVSSEHLIDQVIDTLKHIGEEEEKHHPGWKDSLAQKMQEAKDKLGDIAHSTTEDFGGWKDMATDKLVEIQEKIRDVGDAIRERVDDEEEATKAETTEDFGGWKDMATDKLVEIQEKIRGVGDAIRESVDGVKEEVMKAESVDSIYKNLKKRDAARVEDLNALKDSTANSNKNLKDQTAQNVQDLKDRYHEIIDAASDAYERVKNKILGKEEVI